MLSASHDTHHDRLRQIHRVVRHGWAQVRWKMVAIVAFTMSSTILIACLAVAALNVMVRRESTNVVEKQIQMLVDTSRSIAPAIPKRAGATTAPPTDSG